MNKLQNQGAPPLVRGGQGHDAEEVFAAMAMLVFSLGMAALAAAITLAVLLVS